MRLLSDIISASVCTCINITSDCPFDLSSYKESDIAMNDWQAAANMLEQCNKQMNSPRLLMTDIIIVHSIIKSFLE